MKNYSVRKYDSPIVCFWTGLVVQYREWRIGKGDMKMPPKHFIWLMPLLILMLWLPLVVGSMVWLIVNIGIISLTALVGLVWGVVETTS